MEDSDHQSNQSGTVIGSNDDLFTEIFIRLPVTSILRFKSVSKHWRSLLTHTHFTHRYDNNNNINLSKSAGLFSRNIYIPFDVETQSPPPFRSLDFYFNRSQVTIEQSCNGLLLCSAFHNDAREYYVFNPTTKQLAFIPSVPKYFWCMALAFHQTHCVHYKVVCVLKLEPGRDVFQIQIYSSESRKWKICIESFFVPNPIFHHPVYWNGTVCWPPYFGSRDYFYFKIDVEQLLTFPVPEGLVDDEVLIYFGESRGHLHLILRTKRVDNSLVVYEMLMDCSGWFVKYRVQLDELQGALSEMVNLGGYNFQVVDVVRGKEEEDTFLVLATPGKMLRYNVHDKSFKEFYSKRLYFGLASSFHRYIETLSSF